MFSENLPFPLSATRDRRIQSSCSYSWRWHEHGHATHLADNRRDTSDGAITSVHPLEYILPLALRFFSLYLPLSLSLSLSCAGRTGLALLRGWLSSTEYEEENPILYDRPVGRLRFPTERLRAYICAHLDTFDIFIWYIQMLANLT